jgi:hypothetical protein
MYVKICKYKVFELNKGLIAIVKLVTRVSKDIVLEKHVYLNLHESRVPRQDQFVSPICRV